MLLFIFSIFIQKGYKYKKHKNTIHLNMLTKDLKNIHLEAKMLFENKNADYGDAFATYVVIGVLVRMGDKINRLETLRLHAGISHINESIKDTLIDLNNYSAMAIMLLDECGENEVRTANNCNDDSIRTTYSRINQLKKAQKECLNIYEKHSAMYLNSIYDIMDINMLLKEYEILRQSLIVDKHEISIKFPENIRGALINIHIYSSILFFNSRL